MVITIAGSIIFLFNTIVAPSFFILLFFSLLFATCGMTIGVRRLYIDVLLRIFDYGKETITRAESKTNWIDDECESSDEDEVPVNKGPDHQQSSGHSKANGGINGHNNVISREILMVPEPNLLAKIPKNKSFETLQREFEMGDIMDFAKSGMEAIIEDEVTCRFSAEELKSWNLLTRTNRNYHYVNMRLTIMWSLGFLFRYFILLPMRIAVIAIGILSMALFSVFVGCLPDGKFKRWANSVVNLTCFRVIGRGFSAMITFHNRENRAKGGGICVANHTSPIDVVLLANDNCYALIGQNHGGLLGFLQRAQNRASANIWFERSEVKDRHLVAKRLKEHVEDKNKLPILIFPEGTCINNTSVMQFKKGSFEVGGVIYPVAIKYDPRFGDPFWNSSEQTMVQYLLMMMTSWAIVCEVWYLPPMIRGENEDAIDFANRVKAAIACQGGLVDLMWDGQLKRTKAKKEWREKQQEEYSKKIKVAEKAA